MQLDSDVKPKSLAFNTFKDSAKNGCKAGPDEVIVRFVSDFTSSPIDTLIPAALGEAPTPCPSSKSCLPTWYLLQILREVINGRKSTPCHLIAKEMEAQSSQGMATEDGGADWGCSISQPCIHLPMYPGEPGGLSPPLPAHGHCWAQHQLLPKPPPPCPAPTGLREPSSPSQFPHSPSRCSGSCIPGRIPA